MITKFFLSVINTERRRRLYWHAFLSKVLNLRLDSPCMPNCKGKTQFEEACMINMVYKNIDEVWYGAAVEAEKVLATTFAQNETEVLKNLLKSLPYEAPFQVNEKLSPFSERLLETLKRIYDGEDVSFSFEMSMDYLSSYAQKVLKCVSSVPVGYFTTYGAVAKACGGSARAVGQIMAKNPFAPLVPCHRVVRSDFSVGGYGGGKEVKWEILQREDRDHTESKEIKIGDRFLSVFPIKRLRKV